MPGLSAQSSDRSRTREIVSASAATLVSQFVRIVGGLLTVPYLLQALGAVGYGFVTLMISLVTIFAVLESVLTPVLRNELVKARTGQASRSVEQLTVIGLSASLLLLLLVPLLYFMAEGFNWGRLLGLPRDMPTTTGILAAACIGLLGACTGFIDCIHAAWNQLGRLRLIEASAVACGLAAAVLLAQSGAPLVWLIVAMTSPVPAARIVALALFVGRENVPLRIDFLAATTFFWSHRTASISFVATQALACMASLLPLLLITHSRTLAEVSIFTVSQRLIGGPANLAIAALPVFWPQIARAMNLGENGWLTRTLWRGIGMLTFCTVLAAAISYAIGPWFIGEWTNGGLAISAAFLGLFSLLAGSQVIHAWLSTFLNGLGDFHYQLTCYAFFTLASVMFGAIGLAKFGLEGMAIGLVVATVLFAIAPMLLRVHQRIN